jgi:hypothetical protein
MSGAVQLWLPPLVPFFADRQENGIKEDSLKTQENQSQTSVTLQPTCEKSTEVSGTRRQGSVPIVLICHVLLMAAEPPSNIAPVCRSFKDAQMMAYSKFLSTFAADPRLNFCTKGLFHGSILKMDSEGHCKKFQKIHKVVVRGAKETGVIPFSRRKNPKSSTFDSLGNLAERTTQVKNQDLLTFFNFVQNYLFQHGRVKKLTLTNCKGPSNNAENAASVRQWMNQNSPLLLQIEGIDLDESKLCTVPPEVALCKNATRLSLAKNQITLVTRKVLQNLKGLKILDLENNRVREIADLGVLPELEELHLARNKLGTIQGIDKLTKLTHFCFGENRLKQLPPIGALPKLDKFGFARNPFPYVENFLGAFLLSINKLHPVKRQEYFQVLQKFLLSLSSGDNVPPIQDQIAKEIPSFTDPLFRSYLRETLLFMALYDLFKVSKILKKERGFSIQQLPRALVIRVQTFYHILKKRGDSSDTDSFPFRLDEPCVSSPACKTAIQIVLLELVFVHLGKKYKRRDFWDDILKSFPLLDPFLHKAIHKNITTIINRGENSPVQVDMNSFRNLQSKLVTNSNRIEAIEQTIMEISGEKTIPSLI